MFLFINVNTHATTITFNEGLVIPGTNLQGNSAYDAYGVSFESAVLAGPDDRFPDDGFGITNFPSNGTISFTTGTYLIDITWMTAFSGVDFYATAYDAQDNVVDSFIFDGGLSNETSGTARLSGNGITRLEFHDSGSYVGIDTISFFDAVSFNTSNLILDVDAIPMDIRLVDYTGDGILDLIIANLNQSNLICPGDGVGGFTSCLSVGEAATISFATQGADLDGDGNLDLAFANLGGDSLKPLDSPLLEGAPYLFANPVVCSGLGSLPPENCVYAINGLAESKSVGAQEVKQLLPGLLSGFQSKLYYLKLNLANNGGTVVDLDFNVNPNGTHVAILKYSTQVSLDTILKLDAGAQVGTLRTQPELLPLGMTLMYRPGFTLADFDGNGVGDIIQTGREFMDATLCLGRLPLAYDCSTLSLQGKWGLANGDLNNDGYIDFIATSPSLLLNQTNSEICFNDGSADFTCNDFPASGTSVVIVDINNDGKNDVISVDLESPMNICLGDGLGGFSCSTTEMHFEGLELDIADFNNDSKLDVVIGSLFEDYICFGDGAGNFSPCQAIDSAQWTIVVTAGDLDGDNRTDLVTLGNDGIKIHLQQ